MMEVFKMSSKKIREFTEESKRKVNMWKTKGKPSNRKGQFKFKGNKSNDIGWHTKNQQLVNDTFNKAFNHVIGAPLQFNDNTSPNFEPAVSAFDFDWTMGINESLNTVLNNAAVSLMEFIRKYNSGATNYDSPDPFITVIASGIDILSMANYCIRFFGIMNHWSDRNRIIPRVLFRAMGIDFDDFVKNIANYRSRLNICLLKIDSMAIPKGFPLIDQAISMTTNVFKDEDSDTGREQLYIVNKAVGHIYDPVGDPKGGRVRLLTYKDVYPDSSLDADIINKPVHLTNGVATGFNDGESNPSKPFSFLLDVLDTEIAAVRLNQDYTTIGGDLRKALAAGGSSEGNVWHTEQVTEGYVLVPVYSEEFGKMLHNSSIVRPLLTKIPNPDTDVATACDVYSVEYESSKHASYSNIVHQDNNILKSTIEMIIDGAGRSQIAYHKGLYKQRLLIDSNQNSPTPEEQLLITRYQARWQADSVHTNGNKNYVVLKPTALPSIIFIGWQLYGVMTTGVNSAEVKRITVPMQSLYDNTTDGYAAAAYLQWFDWAPILYLAYMDITTFEAISIQPMGRLNNFVPVENADLERGHQVDLMSLLNVPYGIGK